MKTEKVQWTSFLMVAILATHLVFLSFQASRSLNSINRWFFEDCESDSTVILVEEEAHTKYLQVYALHEFPNASKNTVHQLGSGQIISRSQSLEQQHCMEVHAPPPDREI